MTKYLLTGGLGFIGSNLTPLIPDNQLTIIDKLSGLDLTKSPSMPKTETIIHLASSTSVRSSILYPEQHISHNLAITLITLKHARTNGSTFIFTSSMGAPHSLSPYSASKLACESISRAYAASYGINLKILRLSNVYGPNSIHKDSIISKFIKLCLRKQPLTVIGDGCQTRDFIHVSDVVNTILNPPNLTIFNVSSGKSISINTLTKLIKHLSLKLTSFNPEVVHVQAVKGELNHVSANSDIKPSIEFEQGLEMTFKWFMENYKC